MLLSTWPAAHIPAPLPPPPAPPRSCAAFGPFWGFQEGFWSWLSGVTDNSLYPVLFVENLKIFFPQLAQGWPRM